MLELKLHFHENIHVCTWGEKSDYYIQLVTKTRSSIVRLNRTNIIENSERVTLNGKLLRKDTDYRIDYDFGQVTLLSQEATDPNASLEVDFEYAPFLSPPPLPLLLLGTR